MPGVHDLEERPGGRVSCEVDSDQLDEVLQRLTRSGVRSLVSRPPTLEELFLRHYQKEQVGAAGHGTKNGQVA